ncbi:MAG TPA: hypothetical protein VI942_00840 [Thermoanaerobaculia bacterium]|nr:hypothetical protein [Thermoanaerobaculia bacterium]
MNRWSRIVLGLAVIATAAWLAAGALGYRVADDRSLAIHTLISFVALLGIVLTQGWIAVFAAVSERLVSRRTEGARGELARARRVAVASATLAIAAAAAQFTVANAHYPGRLGARTHLVAGVASAAILLLALAAETRALSRHGRAIAALER